MTTTGPVIIETRPSALRTTRSPSVSPIWVVFSCGYVVEQRGEVEDVVSFSWSAEGRLMVLMPDFQRHSSVVWRSDAWLVHTHHQLSRWCPATIISQMASRSTLTLSWSWGEKRCRTSLALCWRKAARPIRRRGVSHHVTASPIAIYFTIGQMKRLILTICSLMCFFLSHSLAFPHLHFYSPSLFHSLPLTHCSANWGWGGGEILKIICYVGSRFRTQLMRGIMWTGNLNHQLHLLFTIVN